MKARKSVRASNRNGRNDTQAILRHWRETAPNDRTSLLVRDLTRAFMRALQARFATHSVALGHWSFLRVLARQDGLTQRELSVQAGVMEPTTFSALNAMEKLGYVTRRQKPDNRRKIFVYLTPKGRALARKLVPLAERVNKIAATGVSARDVAVTRKTLLALLENLAHEDARPRPRRQQMPI